MTAEAQPQIPPWDYSLSCEGGCRVEVLRTGDPLPPVPGEAAAWVRGDITIRAVLCARHADVLGPHTAHPYPPPRGAEPVVVRDGWWVHRVAYAGSSWTMCGRLSAPFWYPGNGEGSGTVRCGSGCWVG